MDNKIIVKTGGNKASVNTTADKSLYYSELAKKWAIADVIINGEDYSAKYYANVSKHSADDALQSVETAKNNALEKIAADSEVYVAEAKTQADIAAEKALETVETYETAMADISSGRQKALNDITDAADFAVKKLKGVTYPVFCFNSGPVDENGEPALTTETENVITLNAPAVCTTACGETYFITADVTLDVSGFTNGTYNILYNPVTSKLEAYQNRIYKQKSVPKDFAVNDVWLDTSVLPYIAKIKTSETDIVETDIVPIAVLIRSEADCEQRLEGENVEFSTATPFSASNQGADCE